MRDSMHGSIALHTIHAHRHVELVRGIADSTVAVPRLFISLATTAQERFILDMHSVITSRPELKSDEFIFEPL